MAMGLATEETKHSQEDNKVARDLRERRAAQTPYVSTDDEILGLTAPGLKRVGDEEPTEAQSKDSAVLDTDADQGETGAESSRDANENREGAGPRELDEILEKNAELKSAWEDAKAYREVFESPVKAREAVALLADLNRMDALFFSRRNGDHARLAESIADLDSAAFKSLAKAMAGEADRRGRNGIAAESDLASRNEQTLRPNDASARTSDQTALKSAQEAFLQTTNAATVQAVVDAIETQVERLLPEGASKTTKNRVTGEIYRELDATLRDNKQLTQQLREAFRSGSLDAGHQRAIVTLISGRARQTLPSVAKKVMDAWTSTVLAANRDRRTRQQAAEQRVDIAGSGGAGNEAPRGRSPRNLDYSRLSDADILNL